MEKLKKRLDDLELISNNIKLLNEMLSHYKEDAAEHEKAIIEVRHTPSHPPLLGFYGVVYGSIIVFLMNLLDKRNYYHMFVSIIYISKFLYGFNLHKCIKVQKRNNFANLTRDVPHFYEN